jgi:uncharacterized protein
MPTGTVLGHIQGGLMLKSTFCHLPRTGYNSEKKLWDLGIRTWDDLIATPCCAQRLSKCRGCKLSIDESIKHLEKDDPSYFGERLPSNECWRLFPQFRRHIAYLDIETTGLYDASITTIALYDGEHIFHFVRGDNLPDFKRKIRNYRLIVTYNGKTFDVPFIERCFRITVDCPHIDLRYLLHSLGIAGGLKGCERKLGINRPRGMEDLDGEFAVSLWNEYKRTRNEKALETLLAYNVQDVISLEQLLVMAYNRKLRGTPFAKSHSIDAPRVPKNPFSVDRKTVERIRRDWYPDF